MIVITRTDFDPHNDQEWSSIWNGYHGYNPWSNPEWAKYADEDEDRFRSVSIELWETGKLHQPRKFGAHPARRPEAGDGAPGVREHPYLESRNPRV